ncbi:hypothetical protein SDC9_138936 [bioreactor metagenome]|uniref:Uncharacterized protein n=1 Tax=bioreactor metagenome TaxID=1076179 RepID=A0A645DTN6_9ZZZZ
MPEDINPNCACPRKCERHGRCAECRTRHERSIYPVYCDRKSTKIADRTEASEKSAAGSDRPPENRERHRERKRNN